MLGAIESEGSSDSDSGEGADGRDGRSAERGAEDLEAIRVDAAPCVSIDTGLGAGAGGKVLSSEAAGFWAGAGVSSTVECFPVVHGGISRNSSNVSTRGLQHFQPVICESDQL